MSARGFPKCFPGSRPADHVGNVRTNTHMQTQTPFHTDTCMKRGGETREKKKERDQQQCSVMEDDRLGGLQAAAHVNLHPGSICLTLQVVYTDLSG